MFLLDGDERAMRRVADAWADTAEVFTGLAGRAGDHRVAKSLSDNASRATRVSRQLQQGATALEFQKLLRHELSAPTDPPIIDALILGRAAGVAACAAALLTSTSTHMIGGAVDPATAVTYLAGIHHQLRDRLDTLTWFSAERRVAVEAAFATAYAALRAAPVSPPGPARVETTTITHPDGHREIQVRVIEPDEQSVTVSFDARHPNDIGLSVELPSVRELFDAPDDRVRTRLLGRMARRYGGCHLADITAKHLPLHGGPDFGAAIRMTAEIADQRGASVGYLRRMFVMDPQHRIFVQDIAFHLDDHARGNGFEEEFTAASEAHYRASGIELIQLTVDPDDRALTAARSGFDWNPHPAYLARTIANLRTRITTLRAYATSRDQHRLDILLMRFNGMPSEYPSAAEISQLSGDDALLGVRVISGATWYATKRLF